MHMLFVDNQADYSGNLFEPQWIYKNFDIESDSIVAFIGNLEIAHHNTLLNENQFDLFNPGIMLHFLIEHFDNNLEIAVYRKRMFIVSIKEEIEKYGIDLTRIGSDLYFHKRKLSTAIAISSTVSVLLYTAINLHKEDEPIKTWGLRELGIEDIKSFAQNIMLRYKKELEGIYEERCRVRGIRVNN